MTTDNQRTEVEVRLEKLVPITSPARGHTQRRRAGLGRGLGDLLPDGELRPVPKHFQPDAGQAPTIERVAVVESEAGVIVEIEDGAGVIRRASVHECGSVELAVINGVRAMLDIPDDVRIDVSDVDTSEGTVLLVTGSVGGERFVGAAFVEHRREYALARAALEGLGGV